MTGKRKYTYDLLKTLFDEAGTKTVGDYSNAYLTRDTRICGICVICNNTFNKSFDKLYKNKNFTCEDCTKIVKFEKIKNTMNLKYGVEYAAQSNLFQEKMQNTNLIKYGVKYSLQNDEIMDKLKKTNLENHGCEYPMQNKEIQLKSKETCFKNYGTYFNTQSDIVKNKTRETCIKKYGVNHPSQVPEIMEKCIKQMYKIKTYIFPSGKTINIQGYENFALDELIINNNNIIEDDIITGCKNVPTIWYTDSNNKKRRHYVDIYIPTLNLCIEVKSSWTAKLNNDVIFLKQKAAKELGYNYYIWIYDDNGNKINSYE
jgi:hypothetical protein